jgi:hypothetical protein
MKTCGICRTEGPHFAKNACRSASSSMRISSKSSVRDLSSILAVSHCGQLDLE